MSEKKVKDLVRPNVVDGIEEYDNPLPPWWVWLFNLTILFGLAYMIWYHVLDKPGLDAELAADRQELAQKAAMQQPANASAEDLAALAKNPARVEEGKGIYAANCARVLSKSALRCARKRTQGRSASATSTAAPTGAPC